MFCVWWTQDFDFNVRKTRTLLTTSIRRFIRYVREKNQKRTESFGRHFASISIRLKRQKWLSYTAAFHHTVVYYVSMNARCFHLRVSSRSFFKIHVGHYRFVLRVFRWYWFFFRSLARAPSAAFDTIWINTNNVKYERRATGVFSSDTRAENGYFQRQWITRRFLISEQLDRRIVFVLLHVKKMQTTRDFVYNCC